MNNQELVINKIEFAIDALFNKKSFAHNKFAANLAELRSKIIEGKKLTKIMRRNLAWVEENVKVVK